MISDKNQSSQVHNQKYSTLIKSLVHNKGDTTDTDTDFGFRIVVIVCSSKVNCNN